MTRPAAGWVLLGLTCACAPRTPPGPGGDGPAADAGPVSGTDGSVVDLPDAAVPDGLHLVEGLRITRVVVFQAVAVPVWTEGQPVTLAARNAPLLVGRQAAVRVYVEALPDWIPTTVTARVEVAHGPGLREVATDEHVPAPPSADGAPASLFTVMLPAGAWEDNSDISVALTTPNGTAAAAGSTHPAHVPAVGERLGLTLQPTWPVHLHLVPIQYDRDGSHRMPDTSPAQLQRMRDALAAFYPLVDAVITVGDPLPWNQPLTLRGNVNFNALNDAIYDRRAADAPPPDTYYYGLISAADTLTAYCGASCVTGKSYAVDDPLDATIRLGAGMGFGTDDSVLTMIHEVGHMHGRYHAPCDVTGGDSAFPYAAGGIGVWGFDSRAHAFVDPGVGTDFMGYCDNYWVSDYTYQALYNRMAALGQNQKPAVLTSGTWWILHLDADGSSSWGPKGQPSPPTGPASSRCAALAHPAWKTEPWTPWWSTTLKTGQPSGWPFRQRAPAGCTAAWALSAWMSPCPECRQPTQASAAPGPGHGRRALANDRFPVS